MNIDFTKNYSEDNKFYEFEYDKDNFDLNESNDLFNNFASKIQSPNFISYETNEEFIENFLKIGNKINQNSLNKKSVDYSPNIQASK